jgi:hypothetical protein
VLLMIVPQKSGFATEKGLRPLFGLPIDNLLRPGSSMQLLARLRAAALDKALIAGADPADSRQLAARVQTLTSPHSRAAAADGLERWLSAARGATSRRHVLPRRALARENASEVREIVRLLRGSAPLYARGIALLGSLFSDGTGPAYVGRSDVLARRLGEVREIMAGRASAGDPTAGPRPARRSVKAPR